MVTYQVRMSSELPSVAQGPSEMERASELPPASCSESPSIHLAHVAHADDTYDEALHSWRNIRPCGSRRHAFSFARSEERVSATEGRVTCDSSSVPTTTI